MSGPGNAHNTIPEDLEKGKRKRPRQRGAMQDNPNQRQATRGSACNKIFPGASVNLCKTPWEGDY